MERFLDSLSANELVAILNSIKDAIFIDSSDGYAPVSYTHLILDFSSRCAKAPASPLSNCKIKHPPLDKNRGLWYSIRVEKKKSSASHLTGKCAARVK